ncbi:MarR family winged helix-turn-helix transcriptional regulator [Microbacterium abyssi]|uniref:MarR family winged helix-turn-helix transcriptional regulator n=1 Tax=Microbacterium abyssi TaxID=2782166 RepID=UPI00188925F2|nr:MarR family winged helix-turn-helix transcriptional regulator [Microbacterium sp. A18JL241]
MATVGDDPSISGTDSSVPEIDEERIAAVTALESEFGELITHFRRTIMANATRLSPGMLPGAYKTFTTIVRYGSSTASTLAEVLQMDKGQLSRTIRELEDLGLIQRVPDPADRRSVVISPTEEGLARLAAARRPQEGAVLRALGPWPVEDIRSLTDLLHRLTSTAREL